MKPPGRSPLPAPTSEETPVSIRRRPFGEVGWGGRFSFHASTGPLSGKNCSMAWTIWLGTGRPEPFPPRIMMMFDSRPIRLVLWPIAVLLSEHRGSTSHKWHAPMAVSSLSPVATQILMPALLRSAIVSGTPSCKRSSMAVAPRRRRLCSSCSQTSSIFSSRFSRERVAS